MRARSALPQSPVRAARGRGEFRIPIRYRLAWVYVALALLGCALQAAYLALWPLSYRLTHGGAYTYQYLVANESLWLKLYEALGWWEAAFPGIDRSLEINVNALMAVFSVIFALYLVAAALLYRTGAPRGMLPLVVGFGLAFQVTLFFMPGLFTTDIFSYMMYGQIAADYHLNPYIHLPGYFPGHELLEWINPIWHYAPSVYGPVWVNLSAAISALVGDWSLVDQARAYKLAVNLAHLANVGLAWLLLGHFQPRARVAGLLLFAWNPLLLFEFAGNGHNDALMLTFLMGALALYLRGSPWLGLLPLALSIMVKYTTVLVAPFYLMVWARRQHTWAARAAVIAGGGVVLLLVSALLYLPWYEGMETFAPLLNVARGPMYLNHPPDVLADLLVEWGWVGAGLTVPEAQEAAREMVKTLTRVAFVPYFLWELSRLRRPRDLVPAGVRVFLVFLLGLHTWVLSWYFAWPVALAIILGLGSSLGRIAVGFSYTVLVITYFQHYWGLDLDPGRLALYLLPLLAPVVEAALRRALILGRDLRESAASPLALDTWPREGVRHPPAAPEPERRGA